jgi:hypothetical protein
VASIDRSIDRSIAARRKEQGGGRWHSGVAMVGLAKIEAADWQVIE